VGQLPTLIDDRLRRFLAGQHLFFVATAPSEADGHVNVSPKGRDSFRVLDDQTVGYLDFVGSGIETAAHLRQNGRICIMFCAFDGPPNIVRLHGRGQVVERHDEGFDTLKERFPGASAPNARAIVVVRVTRISDSCGYGVPLFHYEGERTQLEAWAERKGPDGVREYQRKKNHSSIDGLPGLRWTD
jgi:hypothetical protein